MRALWSSKQNCSHNVAQKLKRIRRFSDQEILSAILERNMFLSKTCYLQAVQQPISMPTAPGERWQAYFNRKPRSYYEGNHSHARASRSKHSELFAMGPVQFS